MKSTLGGDDCQDMLAAPLPHRPQTSLLLLFQTNSDARKQLQAFGKVSHFLWKVCHHKIYSVFEDISQSIKPGKWNLDWLYQVHSNLFLQRQQISKCKSFFIQKISVCKFYLPKSFSRIYLWKEINLQKMSKVSGKFFYKNTFSRLWYSSLLHWVYPFSHQCTQIPGESSQIISSILQNF